MSTSTSAEPLDLGELRDAHVALVGYSGRDHAAVEAHIEELARLGVPRPPSVPAVWQVPAALLTHGPQVTVSSRDTSGEVEPVIVLRDGSAWLTVGSDHTDRGLERSSMEQAKAACAKVVATDSWPLPDDGSWDRLRVRSSILVDGEWRPYQDAALSQMLPPSWFLDRFGGDGDAVVFCGTVPVLDQMVLDARAFEAQLEDPLTRRTLSLTYQVVVEPGPT